MLVLRDRIPTASSGSATCGIRSDLAHEFFQVRRHGDIAVIVPSPQIEHLPETLLQPAAQMVLAPLKEDPPNQIIIDLSEVTHMDSTGLAELIYVQQRTAEVRGSLALVVTSPGLRRTLEIRGIDGLFTVTASAAEARAVLSTPGQPGDEPPLRE